MFPSVHIDGEWFARLFLVLLLLGLPLAILAAGRADPAIEVRAVMPEKGGWLPDNLTAEVGVPLELRLTSDDVMHGFAVGQRDFPAVDVMPGQVTNVTLTFDEPGTYTYYCTRWCGPNHWRMRGTIEVTGEGEGETAVSGPPLYVTLGLDIDAPHPIAEPPSRTPIAGRAADPDVTIPPRYFQRQMYLTQSPYAVWESLRAEPATAGLTDNEVWNLVASIWQIHADDQQLQLGQTLYAQNCAACHGQTGAGNGVMAAAPSESESTDFGREFASPTDFTDAANMLGASTALLDGKIRRGGMGTGMPYWGTIFTDAEIEALIAYLWTFPFPVNGDP